MSPRDRHDDLDPETPDAFRALDEALRRLPRIEPHPQFEARFRARLARAEEARRRGWRALLPHLQLEWALPASALVAVALALTLANPSAPEAEWSLVADPEGFELVMEADPDLLAMLDSLEIWDATESL